MELKIFDESGENYDQVLSGRAEFDSKTETLYSEGEVVLALGLSLRGHASSAGQESHPDSELWCHV